MRSKLGAVTAASAVALGMVAVAPIASAADDDGPVEAGITVPKVEGMTEDFINGADFSTVLSLEDSGVVFRDDNGEPADLFEVLADHGVNYARIRVWNQPFDLAGNGYGAGNVDAARATEIGQRATAAGMKVLVDFHYSDFWAHPGQQKSPRAWAGMSLDNRVDALYDYTADTLQMMDDAGVDVGMVQIGNETTSGEIAGVSGWDNTARLFQAGSEAVSDTLDDDVKIAVHFTNPERAGQYMSVAKALADRGVDYDVFASSYYAFWHGTLDNLTTVLNNVATTYNKEVMVAETSWTYTLDDGDGTPNSVRSLGASAPYSASVQGQALAVRDVMQAVANVSNGKGLGTFYWEPAWLPVGPPEDFDNNWELWERDGSGWATTAAEYFYDPTNATPGYADVYGGSGWDNQALFDFDGYPLESLNVYEYARTGSVAPRDLDSVVAPVITVTDGETINLPTTVDVRFTDSTTESQSVTWSVPASWITGAGTYAVPGQTSGGYEVTATVTVLEAGNTGENYVVNPGFESGVAPWTKTGAPGTISALDDPFEGTRSTHFYNANAFSFSIQQTLANVPPGTYRLSAKVQGGNAGPSDTIVISAQSGISTKSANAALSGYLIWQTPTTDLLTVGADGVVNISAAFSLSAGAWGTIDNFSLVADSEPVAADVTALEGVLAEAQAIVRDSYSAVSLVAFDRGVRRAQFVLDSPAPSQAAIDAATAELRAGIDGLTEGDVATPDPTVRAVTAEFVAGDAIVLPGTVTVEAFDESTTTESVVWDDVLDLIKTPGIYTVHGVTAGGWQATATVTVTEKNWIVNGGFEQGVDNVAPWSLVADPWPTSAETGTFWVTPTGDAHGAYALNLWNSGTGAPFAFTATQQVSGLEPGNYRLSGGLMGADEGADDAAVELVANPGPDESAVAMELLGWGNWSTPSLDVVVGDSGLLDVQVRGNWGLGDWAWVDDLSLVRLADDAVVDVAGLEAAIAAAAAVDRDAFTAESLAALELAVTRGQFLVDAAHKTQGQVDDAVASIATAIAALVAVAEPEPTPTPTPTPTHTPTPTPTPTPAPEPTSGPAPTPAPSTPSEAKFEVPFNTVVPGQTFELSLTGVDSAEVEIGIASTYQQLATATVVDGTATATVTIPLDIEPGIHHLQAYDDAGLLIAEYEITVVAADADTDDSAVTDDADSDGLTTDEALSTTGADAAILGGLALALLVAGLLITRHTHRRRTL